MKREENARSKRRIPAAALVVAILAIALAGTALAAELINRAKVDLVNPDEAGVSTEGYYLETDFAPIPLEALSKQALDRFASGAAVYASPYDGFDAESVTWYFDSWAEAEEFLGLDLGKNTILEQYLEMNLSGSDSDYIGCVVGAAVIESEGTKIPAAFGLMSKYQIEDCLVTVMVNLEVEAPGTEEFKGSPLGQESGLIHAGAGRYPSRDEQYTAEEYVTPNGLTAAIVNRSGTQLLEIHDYDLQLSTAYFVRGSSSCIIHCKGPDHETQTAMLKQILDAYE